MTAALLAGGGTAGHISPLLALADALRRAEPQIGLLALGTREGLEARLVPARGYELAYVPRVPMPRTLSPALVRLPGSLKAAVEAAEDAIRQVGADVVVGMGGYVSAPAYLAAKRAGIPIVLHEQNARPGLANRLGAALTTHVATTFESTRLRGAVRVGMPLRTEISRLDRAAMRAAARAELGLDAGLPTLLVTGGSLGAQRINEAMAGVAGDLSGAGVQVLHLCGAGKSEGLPAHDGAAPYRVLEYLDRMELAYAAADLVLCRAGANTVCELTTVGLPAVFVPLAIGNGEQRLNADPVVRAGGAVMVDNAVIDAQWLRDNVIPLIGDTERLDLMAKHSAAQGIKDADDRLAAMVLSAAAQRGER